MSVLLKKPWVTSPQYRAEIDWTNPITRNLRFAINPSAGISSVDALGRPITWNAPPTVNAFPKGRLFLFDGSTTYADAGSPIGLQAFSGLTLFSIWRSNDSQYLNADSDRYVLSNRTAGNAGWSWGYYDAQTPGSGASSNVVGQMFVAQGIAAYGEVTVRPIESLIETPVAFTHDGTTGTYYASGKFTSSQAMSAPSTGGPLTFGAQGPYGGVFSASLHRTGLTLAFDRVLSAGEIKSLSDNPWQIFAPQQRKVWVPKSPIPAGGGPYFTRIRKPWTSQPQTLTRLAPAVDTPYSFAGTGEGYVMGGGRNVPYSASNSLENYLTRVFDNSKFIYSFDSLRSIKGPLYPYSVVGQTSWIFQVHPVGTNSAFFGSGDNSGGYVENFDFNLDVNGSPAAGAIRFGIRDASGGSLFMGTTGSVVPAGITSTVVIFLTPANLFRVWINGIEISLTTSGAANPPGTGMFDREWAFNNFNYGLAGWTGGTTGNDHVPASLQARLTNQNYDPVSVSLNPWQLFAPVQRKVWNVNPYAIDALTALKAVSTPLIIKRPWTRQPQYLAPVSNKPLWAFLPLGNTGLSWPALMGAMLYENAIAFSNPGSTAVDGSSGILGPLLGVIPGTGANGLITPPVLNLNAAFARTGQASVVIVCKSQSSVGHGTSLLPIFRLQSAGSSFNHYPFTDGNIYIGPFSATRYLAGTVSGTTAGIFAPHVFIATATSGSQQSYIGGVLRGTGTAVETPAVDIPGGGSGGFGEFGAVYFAAFFDRVLTANEIANFTTNPWQIFAMPTRRIWAGIAAQVGKIYMPQRFGGNGVYAEQAFSFTPAPGVTATYYAGGVQITVAGVTTYYAY